MVPLPLSALSFPVSPRPDPMTARLTAAILELVPRSPADLSEELTALWGEELARYYLDEIVVKRGTEATIDT